MENFYYDDEEWRMETKHEAPPPKTPIAPHFEGLILLRDHDKQEDQPPISAPLPAEFKPPVVANPEIPLPSVADTAAVQPAVQTAPEVINHPSAHAENESYTQQPEQPETPALADQVNEQRRHSAQDAWRRYWVDEHGREIAGATDYGQAYHQERQVEMQATPLQTTSYSPTQATAPIQQWQMSANANPLMQQSPSPAPVVQQENMLPPISAQPAVAQPTINSQHQLPAHTGSTMPFKSPWVWLLAFIVFAAFFATVFI